MKSAAIIAIALILAPAAARGADPIAGKRPNIVFLLTDDQGYGDISAHGNRVVRTPNLDKLRGEGVRFTDFHGKGSNPGNGFQRPRVRA
jgi:hypothetical protein